MDVVRELLSLLVDGRVFVDACLASRGYVLGFIEGSKDLLSFTEYVSLIPPRVGFVVLMYRSGFRWIYFGVPLAEGGFLWLTLKVSQAYVAEPAKLKILLRHLSRTSLKLSSLLGRVLSSTQDLVDHN
ncbi:MAG: hypothetical protein ACK416_00150 [Zestosphaera sp.]